jgi:hypothetical protein
MMLSSVLFVTVEPMLAKPSKFQGLPEILVGLFNPDSVPQFDSGLPLSFPK